jgi:hypothetical protein
MTDGDQPTAINDRDEDEERVRRVVAEWVSGSRLHVQEEKHGLVVANPHARDRGRVHFDFDGGHVSHEHVVYQYWGTLDGTGDEGTEQVTRKQLIRTLIPGL